MTPPLGNGPYKIKNFDAGRYITFVRDPNYWAKDIPTRKGFFNFNEIKYDYYQDTTVTLQALFSGNIDMRYEYIAKFVGQPDTTTNSSKKAKSKNRQSNITARRQPNFSLLTPARKNSATRASGRQ